MRLRRCCLLLVPCFLLPAWSQGGPDSGKDIPTIKTQVRRVLVDVVVTNDAGDPVAGLQAQDFEVQEDGKPQAITSFEEHHGAEPTQIKLPPMPPHVYTNFPVVQTADVVNVLLLDGLNTPTRDQVYVRKQMMGYLKKLPPATRVGIFTLGARLRMMQGITADSSELLDALNRVDAGPHASPLLQSEVEKDADRRLIEFMQQNQVGSSTSPTTLAELEVDPVNAEEEFLAEEASYLVGQRVEITLQALQQLARYLSDVPGRKNVIWFSGSFPFSILPNPDLKDGFVGINDFVEQIHRTANLLAEAQVSIYPVAAEGLASDTVFQANGAEISQKRGMNQMQDQLQQLQNEGADRNSSHVVMEQLAQDTGGKAFYNTNGVSDALARVVKNGSSYYSLTYAPSNATTDGKFRRIQVKLLRSRGKLSYRRGYYADDSATALTAGQKIETNPLMLLMGRNLPNYSQIVYKVLAQELDPQPAAGASRIGGNQELKGPTVRYGVDFAIAAEDLKFDQGPDGVRHGTLEVALVAYDREGKPLNLVNTIGDLNLPPDVYVNVQQIGLQIHKEIDVPKGYFYMRTGIYDQKAGTAGTLGFPMYASTSAGK